MSYLLHVATDTRYEVDGKEPQAILAELAANNLRMGMVTLRTMLAGDLASSAGFDYVESLTPEEQAEQDAAHATVAAQKTAETVQEQTEAELPVAPAEDVKTAPRSAPEDTVTDPVGEADAAAVTVGIASEADDAAADPETAARAQAIRDRMLGTSTQTANLTPAADTEPKRRRHNERKGQLEYARNSEFGAIIKAIEEGVSPKLELNYVHPDLRWLEFILVDSRNPEKPNDRKNDYLDISPLRDTTNETDPTKLLGWSFGLYHNGKSATKRQKPKETDPQIIVAKITEWLATKPLEAKPVEAEAAKSTESADA